MSAPATIDEFLETVTRSALLERSALDAYVGRLRDAGESPDTPETLAAAMVRDGLLTRFQAQQLLQGKWRRFIISGKYKLLGHLGTGGMGSVYLCEHMTLRRRVALKVLPAARAKDPSSLERFYREARAVAALDHPNIVHAHDIDRDGDLHFLVMEHVDGASLQEIVSKRGPMDWRRAAHYIRQAAAGLEAASAAGLVHRDIKPANLLLDRSGTVKILDMGLARFFNDQSDNLSKKYNESVLGTADYLAPEQTVDSDVDVRADIYSLGATFYFLLTGRPPFGEGTMAMKLIWHQARTPQAIRSLRPEVPEGLAAVVEKMMVKEPVGRYQTPAEVVAALAPWTVKPVARPTTTELRRPSALHGGGQTELPLSPSAATSTGLRSSGASGGRTVRPTAREETPSPKQSAAGPRTIIATHTPSPAPVSRSAAQQDTVHALAGKSTVRPAKQVDRKTPVPVQARSRSYLWWVAPAVLVIGGAGAGVFVWWTHAHRQPQTAATATGPDRRESAGTGPEGAAQTKGEAAARQPAVGEIRRLVGHAGPVESVVFSPDGRQALSASHDRTVRLWDLATGQQVRIFTGHANGVHQAVFSPDGRQMLSASFDHTVRLWDIASSQEVRQFLGHQSEVNCVAFSPDGKRAISGSGAYSVNHKGDYSLRLWDVASGKELQKCLGHSAAIWSAGFLPDGRRALSGSLDGTMRLWDTQTGKELHRFDAQTGPIHSIAVAADGRRAVAGSRDKTVRLWNVESGELLRTLAGNGGSIPAVALSRDGRYALSGSDDQTMRLWDVDNGRELQRYLGHDSRVWGVAFSPNGHRALSASMDKTICLWGLPQEK